MLAVIGDLGGHGLGPALVFLNALGDKGRQREGLASIGGLVESQTRRRFTTRVDPEGKPWAPWSASYAGSRRKGHSLLVNRGDLRDSIQWLLGEDELQIGSNLVYAAIQQAGGTEGMAPGPAAIPARAYLGLSEGDVSEINAEIEHWVGGLLH